MERHVGEVSTLHIFHFPQLLTKGLPAWGIVDNANPRDLRDLLRRRNVRPTNSQCATSSKEFPPPHGSPPRPRIISYRILARWSSCASQQVRGDDVRFGVNFADLARCPLYPQ